MPRFTQVPMHPSKVYGKRQARSALQEIVLAADAYVSCLAEFDGYPQYCTEAADHLEALLARHRDLVREIRLETRRSSDAVDR